MKAYVSILLLALTISACTSSTSSTTGGGGGGVALDDLTTTLVDRICTALVACPVSKSSDGVNVSTVEGCKAILDAEGMGDLNKYVAAVKAGTIKYDPVSAQACVDAMANCNAFSNQTQPAACTAAFTGTIADKGACKFNEECVSAYCLAIKGCGTCTARAAEGAACDGSDSGCQTGLTCQSQKCAKPPAGGQIGSDCNGGSGQCPDGAFCGVASGATKPTCLAQLDSGAACSGSGQCKTGFYCLPGSPSGTCTAVAKAGDACTMVQGIDPTQPCDATSICVAGTDGKGTCKTYVGPGSACASSLECRGMDLLCTDGKCAVLGAKGATCVAPTSQFKPLACLPGLSCTSGKCADAPAIGQPCPDHACATGASCDNGTCKGKPGNGEPCYGSCADGFYCDMSGTSGSGNCKAAACQ